MADNISTDIPDINNDLHLRVKDTFLMPNHFKSRLLSSEMHNELTNLLEEFFDEFGSLEEEILNSINDEFPVITKQMMKHIDNISSKNDVDDELESIVQNIHLYS